MHPSPVQLAPASVDEVLATGLLDQLDADLRQRYPGEPVNGIDPEPFRAAGGYFVLARFHTRPVGCGAFRPYQAEAGTVEIKRIFVHPELRGRGLARRVMEALEAEARRRGFTHAILETAGGQPEAIGLYRSCGYAEIPAFEPYVHSVRSMCFWKAL